MTEFLSDESYNDECPHIRSVAFKAGYKKVLVNGKPLVTAPANFFIIGCKIGNNPCKLVNWMTFSNKILLNGILALVKGDVGLCIGCTSRQISEVSTQKKVKGM